ncbi:MAG: SRPBCC family protein [Bacteroidia bacterium]
MSEKNKTIVIAEPGKQELFIIREFDAPRELVFRAFNEPDLLLQWLGPRDQSMEIEKLDSRTGGSYRFIHCHTESGRKYGFNGVIHEVTAPERMIRTFEFEGLPERGHVSLETATFEALPGERTKLTIQSVFKSVMDRDGMIQSGMERGLTDSQNRLDELLIEMISLPKPK